MHCTNGRSFGLLLLETGDRFASRQNYYHRRPRGKRQAIAGTAGFHRAGRTDVRFLHAGLREDRKSTRLNSSHLVISYAVFCLKKKKRAYPRSSCRVWTLHPLERQSRAQLSAAVRPRPRLIVAQLARSSLVRAALQPAHTLTAL